MAGRIRSQQREGMSCKLVKLKSRGSLRLVFISDEAKYRSLYEDKAERIFLYVVVLP